MGGVTLNFRPQCLHSFGSGTGATVTAIAANNPNILSGQRVGIYRLIVTVNAVETLTIQDSGGNALSQPFQLAANGSIVLDMPDNGDPWWQSTGANPGIQFAQSVGTTTVTWDIWWFPTV